MIVLQSKMGLPPDLESTRMREASLQKAKQPPPSASAAFDAFERFNAGAGPGFSLCSPPHVPPWGVGVCSQPYRGSLTYSEQFLFLADQSLECTDHSLVCDENHGPALNIWLREYPETSIPYESRSTTRPSFWRCSVG